MSLKSNKKQKFLDIVYEEISSVVDAYEEGNLKSLDELKTALADALTVSLKQSFINGIEVGKRNKKTYAGE